MRPRAQAVRAVLLIAAAIALLSVAPLSHAGGDVRLLDADAWRQLVADRAGKPFMVALWSVTCPHCPGELRALGELRRKHAGLDIVLVAADTPSDAAEAAQLAEGYGLGDSEQWVFADEIPERLRMAIDRRWHGELPRTYFFGSDGTTVAVSGVVAPARLEEWARAAGTGATGD